MSKFLFSYFFVSLLTVVSVTSSYAADDFCWKDSYGRGVGTIPTACDGGKEYQAGLCYNQCPAGMYGVGPVCWSNCPAGYTDMGAVCHINMPLTTSGTGWYCDARDGWGTCWLWKLSCQPGYTNAGLFCALTARPTPAGFSGTYLDPMKNTSGRGVGTIPTNCGPGKQYDAGLCYDTCRPGYGGVGPVCWGGNPPGWVGCGMGSAKDSTACARIVVGQVASVGQLAMTAATLGASTAATGAAQAAKSAEELSRLRQAYDAMKKAYEANKQLIQAAAVAKKMGGSIASGADLASSDNVTPEDIARLAAEIAAIAD
ncbi:MAG: hypothetical protein EBU49_15470, partial [Proteobacteria bacterium]|nr:hypothetical protein [Pseudomonadota bacterium]